MPYLSFFLAPRLVFATLRLETGRGAARFPGDKNAVYGGAEASTERTPRACASAICWRSWSLVALAKAGKKALRVSCACEKLNCRGSRPRAEPASFMAA